MINYPTQLHLVGHFCKNCIVLLGTMNVKMMILIGAHLHQFGSKSIISLASAYIMQGLFYYDGDSTII
jgi:hypothetical protein